MLQPLRQLAFVAAIMAVLAASAVHAEIKRLSSLDHVFVRTGLDGSGPSHLIARDRALIVLDPNRGLLLRYELDMADHVNPRPSACSLPRNFFPRFVQPAVAGLRILGEELRPSRTPSNAALPTLEVSDLQLAEMKAFDGTARPPSCGQVRERSSTVHVEARRAGDGWLVSAVPGAKVTTTNGIRVSPERKAELYDARAIGRSDLLGTAILRREIVGSEFGRVNVALWITLYRSGHPTSIRLYDYGFTAKGKVTGLIKRGFEYAAVTGHSLYVMGTTCDEGVCISRYELSEVPFGSGVGVVSQFEFGQ